MNDVKKLKMSFNIVEYVWRDAEGGMRSKTRIVMGEDGSETLNLLDVPNWNYDGSSTGQAECKTSDVELEPVFIVPCPFDESTFDKYYVLCDMKNQAGEYLNEKMDWVYDVFAQYEDTQRPMYGLEQEYFFVSHDSLPCCTMHQYCGANINATMRKAVEEHFDACLRAGLTLSGYNAEVAPSQWEFQVGPVEGIEAAHQLLMARFLLERVAERHGMRVTFEPRPDFTLHGTTQMNGSGCHMNFSTEVIRNGGMAEIEKVLPKLEAKHAEFMPLTGKNNHLRMTGSNETSSYNTFSYGHTDRGCSIRVPLHVSQGDLGEFGAYFEDRRPGSNADPYLICAHILETINQESAG